MTAQDESKQGLRATSEPSPIHSPTGCSVYEVLKTHDGPGVQQCLHSIGVPVLCSKHQWGLLLVVDGVFVAAAIKKKANNLHKRIGGSHVQRRVAMLCCCGRVCASIQQHSDKAGHVLLHGKMDGEHAVSVGHVDPLTRLHDGDSSILVPALNRLLFFFFCFVFCFLFFVFLQSKGRGDDEIKDVCLISLSLSLSLSLCLWDGECRDKKQYLDKRGGSICIWHAGSTLFKEAPHAVEVANAGSNVERRPGWSREQHKPKARSASDKQALVESMKFELCQQKKALATAQKQATHLPAASCSLIFPFFSA